MPIGSGWIGRSGVKTTPGKKGPHRGLAWRQTRLSQVNPPPSSRIFDATVPTYPTAFADVRASSATDYNSSGILTTVASNTQRIDYNPATLALRGLLVEPAGTNLLVQSNFASGWTGNSGGTLTAASGTSPDGTTDAPLLTSNVGTVSFAGVFQVFTTVFGTTITVSCYAKATGSARWIFIDNFGSGGGRSAWFDLVNGVIGSADSGITNSIQSIGNGWYRCSHTMTVLTSSPQAGVFLADADASTSYSGSTTGPLIYGIDAEAAATASSYVATTTASATRAADSISFTLNASATQLTFTFDDLSTQIVSGLTGGSTYTIPTNLNRPWILYIDDNSGGVATDNAALAATEAADVAAFAVSETINAALASTEAQDVALINASETDVAVLAATEAQDVAAIVAQVKDNAALAATEAQDVAAINASVGDNAALAATEAQDVALINVSESDVAVLTATEIKDVAAFAVTETDNAALTATEAPDIAAIVANIADAIIITATEAPDTASIVLSNPAVIGVSLAATERSDIAAMVATIVGVIDPGLPTNRFIWPRTPERHLF
jgi:hypothetical protein